LILNMDMGNIGVSPFPRPLSAANKKFLETIRPSGDISVPKLMLLKGTCAPALE